MPLRKQPLPIQFAGGVETRQDSKQVPTTRLLALENATFKKATTLSKRNGYRALSKAIDGAGTDYAEAVGLAKRGDEVLLFTDKRCYSYRESVDKWADAGEVASVITTDAPIARTGTAQTMPDHASNGGVTAIAWEDSRGGVWMSVVETSSGRILLTDTQVDANGSRPRCVPCGDVVHVYWARAAASRIYCVVVSPVSPSATPTPVILIDDLNAAAPGYDACPAGPTYADLDTSPAVIAWSTAVGMRVGYVHPAGMIGSPVSNLPSAATYPSIPSGPIAVAFDKVNENKVGVAFMVSGGTDLRVYTMPYDTLTGGSFVVVESTGGVERVSIEFDGTYLWWASEHTAARVDLRYVNTGSVTMAPAVATASTSRRLRGHCLAARAFYDAGSVYVGVVHAVEFFPYVAFARISGDNWGSTNTTTVARLLPGQSTGALARGHLPSVQPLEPDEQYISRRHQVCLGYRIQLDSEDGDQWSEAGISLATLDFDSNRAYQTAELGRGLYMGGGVMLHYDGRRWAEADFHAAPDLATGATAWAVGSNSGGSMADGTYSYIAVYEEVDGQGELHQSACSVEVLATVAGGGGSGRVTCTVPTLRLTNRKNVRISVFRAPVNQTGRPTDITYYRVTSTDPTVAAGNNRFVINDASVDTITFVDGLSSADLLLREPLYANGGIISNDPAPMSGAVICAGKNRLFWVDQTDPNVVRFSKPLADDTAAECPVRFSLRVDPYGGPIVALGVLDETIVVFKETAIHVFAGPGPLANPEQQPDSNGFTPSALLTSDVGCIAPGSVEQTPAGIVFQSAAGIMLLGRDRQVKSIGTPVDAYNDQRVMRATRLPDRSQILFLTDEGKSLLFDYERGQWSTFTNHEGYDAVVTNNTYRYLRTDGRVFVETPEVYRDDGNHIRMRIDTAWIKFAGYLQGWQRVIDATFLGAYKSTHSLEVRYRVDYEEGWSAPYTLDVDNNYDPDLYGEGAYGSGPYGGEAAASTVYQRTLHLNERCQAIQFRVEDAEPTDTYGAAFELSELLLTGGVLGPAFRPGDARSD